MSRKVSMQFGKPVTVSGGSGGNVVTASGAISLNVSTSSIAINRIERVGNIVCITFDATLNERPSSTWWTLGTIPSEFVNGADFYFSLSIPTQADLSYAAITSDGIISVHERPGTASRRISFTVSYVL